ncbi:MAG: N-acetylneuraminate synthase [Phycisphaerae bacterium]|nr:N-acetylneuraminate synthase [Phycisphaerae bacterium]
MMLRDFPAEIDLGERKVGPGHPVYVIAEAGPNHNRDFDLAIRLIDVAVEAKADSVKFQTYSAEQMYSKQTKTMEYLYEKGVLKPGQTVWDMIKSIEIPRQWQKDLAAYCRQKNITFLSTPFDLEAVEELEAVGCPAYKIASFEIVHYPLLKACAQTGKPILLSTGMASLGDIEQALEAIWSAGGRQVLLFHCEIAYPPRFQDVHLRAIQTMAQAFGTPVGWSDHTTGYACDIAAVALGACAIEKHYTVDKSLPGPDHHYALLPDELAAMVKAIRETQAALGTPKKGTSEGELEMYHLARRSLVAARAVKMGQTIGADAIAVKRPGYGIHPQFLDVIVGRKAARDIQTDDVLTWDMI